MKKQDKKNRLKAFVQQQTQEGAAAGSTLDLEAQKGKSAQQEVCNFISEFQDGEDESIQSVCDISNIAMSLE